MHQDPLSRLETAYVKLQRRLVCALCPLIALLLLILRLFYQLPLDLGYMVILLIPSLLLTQSVVSTASPQVSLRMLVGIEEACQWQLFLSSLF